MHLYDQDLIKFKITNNKKILNYTNQIHEKNKNQKLYLYLFTNKIF